MLGLFPLLAARWRKYVYGDRPELPQIVAPKEPAVSKVVLRVVESLDDDERNDENVAFEKPFRLYWEGKIKKLFYAKVVGVTFPNTDGSNRLSVIRKCKMGEILQLKPHLEIEGHPNAVGVHRLDGEQLGYLDSELAGEVLRDQGGKMWLAVFRQKYHYPPETRRVVGAALCMIRLADESAPL